MAPLSINPIVTQQVQTISRYMLPPISRCMRPGISRCMFHTPAVQHREARFGTYNMVLHQSRPLIPLLSRTHQVALTVSAV